MELRQVGQPDIPNLKLWLQTDRQQQTDRQRDEPSCRGLPLGWPNYNISFKDQVSNNMVLPLPTLFFLNACDSPCSQMVAE